MVDQTEPLFDVRGLRIVYRRPGAKPLEAVKGVDFTLAEGETLGIVGESGSGKSTIAKALMLLLPVAGGEIRFCGQDITRLDAAGRCAYRQDVQMVFQDAAGSLNPRMTIRQTLEEIIKHTVGGVRGRQSPRGHWHWPARKSPQPYHSWRGNSAERLRRHRQSTAGSRSG